MPGAVSSLQHDSTVYGISGGCLINKLFVDMRKKRKKTTVVRFLTKSFYFGLREINGPLLYIQLYSLDRSHTLEMKELNSILLMTCFCKFNLENLVIHAKKILESDIWSIILPIFHCRQNEMVRGGRLYKNNLLTAAEVQMLEFAESSSLTNMRLLQLHIYRSSQ